MVKDLTRTRSEITSTSSLRKVAAEDKSLVQAMVQVRQIQGWGLQKPEDAKLMGKIWQEQMNRHNIRHELYSKLVDMAVDHRVLEITQGKRPTDLTVELLISCYHKYRVLKLEELNKINAQIDYYRSLRHRYLEKDISLSKAARQLKFQEDISEEEFLRVADDVISSLEKKSENFMEDNLL